MFSVYFYMKKNEFLKEYKLIKSEKKAHKNTSSCEVSKSIPSLIVNTKKQKTKLRRSY